MTCQQKLITTLKKKHLSLALVESATAGYASYLVTTVAGASVVFKGGLIVYSLDAKSKFFGIKRRHLERTQGVSSDIALTLARKIRLIMKADIAGSVVGFAGPKAKKEIPVGTIYIGIASARKSLVKKYIISGSRNVVRKKAAKLLISLINERLANI